jgi:hypothetical protein
MRLILVRLRQTIFRIRFPSRPGAAADKSILRVCVREEDAGGREVGAHSTTPTTRSTYMSPFNDVYYCNVCVYYCSTVCVQYCTVLHTCVHTRCVCFHGTLSCVCVCLCVCLLLQDLVQSCLHGGGGYGRVCVCLLLQDLVQRCLHGGGGIWEDMCYERRRAEACVD